MKIIKLWKYLEINRTIMSPVLYPGQRSIHWSGCKNILRLKADRSCLHSNCFDKTLNRCHVKQNFVRRITNVTGPGMVNGKAITTEHIENTLKKYVSKYEMGHTCFVTTCPKLGKKHLSLVDESDRLYINATTGHFICQHCKKSGPWYAFEDNVKALQLVKSKKKTYDCVTNIPAVLDIGEEPKQAVDLYQSAESIDQMSVEEFENMTSDFECYGLLRSVMSGYGVKFVKDTNTLLFPYFNLDQKLLAVKKYTASVSEDEGTKLKHSFVPRQGTWQLFGWKKAQMTKGSIVITASELDAVAVSQSTGQSALSLPKGFTMLPQEILPFLERFDKVIFWLGNDARSWDAAKQFAHKINEQRSYVIRPSFEDPSPLEALQNGVSLTRILDKARPFVHQAIVSFSKLKEEVFSELSLMEQVSGVKWKRYHTLNKLLKGHRRGELTVFTGPTGSGKTTFMSEYSLDLCMQGVSTLWGSFEIQNVRLARVMLMQYSLKNLHNHLDEFDYWSEKFEQLPMHFMTFFGQEDITKVLEVMAHAVYVHDIGHVIVDNLQFMMGMDFNITDRFVKQDRIVAAFRKFATQKNCHVTLIIHPRKERDEDDLTVASIFGSAKVSQEADNIMILQDKTLTAARGRKFIQVVKNRYSGDRGIVQLKFHGDSLTFSGVAEPKEKGKIKEQEVVKTLVASENLALPKDISITEGDEKVKAIGIKEKGAETLQQDKEEIKEKGSDRKEEIYKTKRKEEVKPKGTEGKRGEPQEKIEREEVKAERTDGKQEEPKGKNRTIENEKVEGKETEGKGLKPKTKGKEKVTEENNDQGVKPNKEEKEKSKSIETERKGIKPKMEEKKKVTTKETGGKGGKAVTTEKVKDTTTETDENKEHPKTEEKKKVTTKETGGKAVTTEKVKDKTTEIEENKEHPKMEEKKKVTTKETGGKAVTKEKLKGTTKETEVNKEKPKTEQKEKVATNETKGKNLKP